MKIKDMTEDERRAAIAELQAMRYGRPGPYEEGPLTKGQSERDAEIESAQRQIEQERRDRAIANRKIKPNDDPTKQLAVLRANNPGDARYELPDVNAIDIAPCVVFTFDDFAVPCIYLIEWEGTGLSYVGQTRSFIHRMSGHFSGMRLGEHPNEKVMAAFRDMRRSLLRVRILERCHVSLLLIREAQWIERLKPRLNIAMPACFIAEAV